MMNENLIQIRMAACVARATRVQKLIFVCYFRQHGCAHGLHAKARQEGSANRRDKATEVKSRDIERAGFGTALFGFVPAAVVIDGE